MSRFKTITSLGATVLAAGAFIPVKDPLVIKTHPNSQVKHDCIKNQTYYPKLSMTNGHWCSWMTGIKTNFNREIYCYLKFKREIFVIKDGTEIAIDYNIDQNDDRPMLIIIPGLLSNYRDHYHHTLIEEAT
jgi:predicted alpha/beta-fold hydrolase